ncbi:MAG TPA: hypothetical protein DCZ12_08645, partial [Gammaproteobacteria bacterium]|nr:hypothetical protein [Gammaproteobacteria bacterium]
GVLRFPKITLAMAGVVFLVGIWPLNKIGSEFIPDLDEGDLMYMPTTAPALSPRAAGELLAGTADGEALIVQ